VRAKTRSLLGPFQRVLVLVGLALMLPTVVSLLLEFSLALRQERQDLEAVALARAEQISALVDSRLQADLAALRVGSTSRSFQIADYATSYERAQEMVALNPGWKALILSDPAARRELWDTSQPLGKPLKADPAPGLRSGDLEAPVIGDVHRAGRDCPCVTIDTSIARPAGPLGLTLVLDPKVFQDILAPNAPAGGVSAITDRKGNFVARSLDYDARVGTPGTRYVREAVRAGGSGLYKGVTYEGLKNYTAYYTSPVTGWSVHVAADAAAFDRPALLTNGLRIGGVLLVLLLSAGLVALALNELAVRRRDEEHLRQAQKLEALGRLTGGVAHDFNNLLTVIIGGLEMLRPRLSDPRSERLAGNALEAARRGAKLTGQLLAFSRSQKLEIGPVDLAALLAGMDDLLRQSVGPSVALSIQVDETARWVMNDANQLETAILNLAINARDAMPTGGALSISARPTESAPDFVEVEVADTGVGMPKEVADRALEPFFTTKPPDKGTGLGLAQVFGAVKQAGGSLVIDSEPGLGTTIRLLLPRAADPGAAVRPHGALPPGDPAHGEHILVVDDDPGVRAVICETLRNAGYDVAEAGSAAAGLAAIAVRPPDLLVTDFLMPDINGAEFVRAARERRPGLRALIVSGYADSELVAEARADAPLLRKPFERSTLLAAIARALGGPAA
jgi:signal transduction histidine kinase/CheY-like chemotaxis protein